MIDTLRHHETPEGVALTLRLAGPIARAGAWVVDAGIRLLVYFGLGFALALLGTTGTGVFLVIFFLLEWFWAVPFEIGARGASPGKRMLGLRVVQRDGTPVGLSGSVVRNLLRAVDFFPFAYGIGFVTMLVSKEFQRLGDLAAGTVVIHDDRPGPHLRAHAATGSPVAPPVALTLEERHALTEFAARTESWSKARRSELADVLTPLTGKSGEPNVARVLAMAAWVEEQG